MELASKEILPHFEQPKEGGSRPHET
jgi:hypothetical protein